MWLINVDNLQLEEHLNPTVPYAILSHTWGTEEVSFQDFRSLNDAVKRKAGFPKIAATCRLAKSRGLLYAWVDTCCIDKSSSAELSEAINSMFRWYQSSKVCFAYLADVHDDANSSAFPESFTASRWFTRGWTLQELVAPKNIVFYNAVWEQLGYKETLAMMLTSITGIDSNILFNKVSPKKIPVATRMSWASKRQTTRLEDAAYCLLGLFDINMPLLYGEGQRAFARLQSEILQETNDLSLLAWTSETTDPGRQRSYDGVFAESPAQFAACLYRTISNTPPLIDDVDVVVTRANLMVSTTLHMQELVEDGAEASKGREYVLLLQCSDVQGIPAVRRPIGIYVSKTPSGFIRHKPWMLAMPFFNEAVLFDSKPRLLKLLRHISFEDHIGHQDERFRSAVFIRLNQDQSSLKWLHHTEISKATPDALWDGMDSVFLHHERFDQISLTPQLLQISLLGDNELQVGKLFLVSIMSNRVPSERWAILLSNYEDPIGVPLLRNLGNWDTASLFGGRIYFLVRPMMERREYWPDQRPAVQLAIQREPAEGVASPNCPASRILQLSEHRRVLTTLSVIPSDAGRYAWTIQISVNDVDSSLDAGFAVGSAGEPAGRLVGVVTFASPTPA
ncbi:Vegetative incompatibility protein HET-E-1 [Colletotrichum fructicola]|nr:Vegetative incompatibility protein HET-E-1 [Colletotrichum fructicola]KAF4940450.1 Vegetative incompatibility protein HET-E-1 [Colletotrichum fructicola]